MAFQVAMLDIGSLSILFLTDCLSSSSSAAVSLAIKTFPHSHGNLNCSENRTSNEFAKEIIFILTRDGDVVAMDSTSGNMISSQSMHQTELAAISI